MKDAHVGPSLSRRIGRRIPIAWPIARHIRRRVWGHGRPLFRVLYPYISRRYWDGRGGEPYYQKITESVTPTSPILLETHLRTQARVSELLAGIQFETLLEVGTGFGWNLAYLKERFPTKTFVGCDFSDSQLAKAKELHSNQIRFEYGDATKLPYDTASFDVVITVGCLIHIPPRSIHRAADELQRVAGSYLIVMEEDRRFIGDERLASRRTQGHMLFHDYATLFGGQLELITLKNESPDLKISLDTHFYRRRDQ